MNRRSALVGDEPRNVLGPLSVLFEDVDGLTFSFREAVDEMKLGSREGVIPISEEYLESAYSKCSSFVEGKLSDKTSRDETAAVHMYSLEFKDNFPGCMRSIYSVRKIAVNCYDFESS